MTFEVDFRIVLYKLIPEVHVFVQAAGTLDYVIYYLEITLFTVLDAYLI